MKAGSKRGAALAIVIIVSAAILILSAALISAAAYNISSTQNGQEGRQAYLDAKSAIEYGKAYVSKNPNCGDFTVLADSASDSGYKTGAEASDSLAAYTSADKTIRAKAKYKSSDRFGRLEYQFPAKTAATVETEYSVFGVGYGDKKVIDNFYYPQLINDRESDYPVVIKRGLEVNSGWDTPKKLSAPQIFLMCENETRRSLWGYTSFGELQSDFIYIAGNITGQDYRNYPTEPTHNYTKLLLETLNEEKGIICFGQDCQITVDMGGSKTRKITIKKGYYSFNDQTDLFDRDINNKLTKYEVKPQDGYEASVNYVNAGIGVIFSGDSWDECQGTQWTIHGDLSKGLSSVKSDGYRWTFDKLCSGEEKLVYLYVNNCSGWGNSSDIWVQDKAQYIAKEIHLQYVNSSKNFTVPASKTVVFQADNISLNTQKSDTEVGKSGQPKITFADVETKGSYANFILRSTDGTKDLYLTCPNDITVYYSDPTNNPYSDMNVYKQTYTISSGTYHINRGIGVSGKGINLFTHAAEKYFASTKPTEGSGSTTETGGYYSYD